MLLWAPAPGLGPDAEKFHVGLLACTGASATHVALSGDSGKMEAPAWASFNAVESLTENHGMRSGVSAWAAGTAEGQTVTCNGQQQLAALQTRSGDLTAVLSSASTSHWLDQSIAAASACGSGEQMEPASTFEIVEGKTPTKPQCQATIGADVVAHN